MGGCFSSLPGLDDPEVGKPHTFKIKKSQASPDSRNFEVFNEDDEHWLLIKSDSDFSDPTPNFSLVNKEREHVLGKCEIGVENVVCAKDVDWDGSDDSKSDESKDSMFDFDESELKVKLRWKIKRSAKFSDEDGREFATVGLQMKGLSKCEVEIDEEKDKENDEDWDATAKVKEVTYTLSIDGKDYDVSVERGNWEHWDRKWKVDNMFEVEYKQNDGADEVIVKTTDLEGNPGHDLLIAFAMSEFMHPCRQLTKLNQAAVQIGKKAMMEHRK
ncbi:hypothetical protein Pmar_PMAR005848 [Perkinsus marinus ATCC 50983]|uniref:Uncharacterized protein n=1 Tax=Perkinsus marinus (strain ATCC 50983 / TXsc) TaxID=423536 RepID=C5KYD6_PERM5|nr:hypothetical protein Pmar_PMAR005848 [Perkinsus marinus ATCC 50983]EER10513.1 hypothetical protein Pmar_PMAR005848 [Perkinsus marinus ATCC 50983]|eukprot:XP_002778718.1 hypothetical protein Pmar_PMAR005848 [Perkinsus marinus ATCC 50983]